MWFPLYILKSEPFYEWCVSLTGVLWEPSLPSWWTEDLSHSGYPWDWPLRAVENWTLQKLPTQHSCGPCGNHSFTSASVGASLSCSERHTHAPCQVGSQSLADTTVVMLRFFKSLSLTKNNMSCDCGFDVMPILGPSLTPVWKKLYIRDWLGVWLLVLQEINSVIDSTWCLIIGTVRNY